MVDLATLPLCTVQTRRVVYQLVEASVLYGCKFGFITAFNYTSFVWFSKVDVQAFSDLHIQTRSICSSVCRARLYICNVSMHPACLYICNGSMQLLCRICIAATINHTCRYFRQGYSFHSLLSVLSSFCQ